MYKITQEVDKLPEKFTGIVEHANGNKEWYLDGVRHREDGPAREYANGDKAWYLNGKVHREDGPAVESANGKTWYLNNKLHREDGPAVERVNRDKHWFYNGKCHRVDGPAREWADGYKEWYLNGKRFASQEDWQKALEKSKAPCNNKTIKINGKKYKLILSKE